MGCDWVFGRWVWSVRFTQPIKRHPSLSTPVNDCARTSRAMASLVKASGLAPVATRAARSVSGASDG